MTNFFAILTADGLDQIVETQAIANREARNLRNMGIDRVKIVPLNSEQPDDEAERAALKHCSHLR